LARFLYISKEKGKKIMKTYIYLILTKGSDGKFTTSAYQTIEGAKKALEMYTEAQKDIEALDGNIYVDRHELERLSVPGFILGLDDVIEHVTINVPTHFDGKDRVIKTDRYIVRVQIS